MKLFTSTVILTLLSLHLVGQDGFTQKTTISLGEHTAFALDHVGAEKKMVEKSLEETFKQYGKVKRNRKANEWSCMDCTIPGIGAVNAYYKVEEGKGQVTSYILIDNGSEFVAESNGDIDKLNTEVYNGVKKMVISKELEGEEKTLKNNNKDLSKLEKKNKDLHKDIEEYKEKIRKAEKEIEQNLQAQEDQRIVIEQQKKVVSEVTERLNNVGRNQ